MCMPSKNIVKVYDADAYYHVYNRGVNKQRIFIESADYAVFLNLLKRYLSEEISRDSKGREYANYYRSLDLLAFCLMPNHFHLFIFQSSEEAMVSVMRAVCGSYTIYFNKKYDRVGPLFQARYKASLITNEAYYQHISRYIHLNPKDYLNWEWSSLPYYLGKKQADWVKGSSILDEFDGVQEYAHFLADYAAHKEIIEEMKDIVAG